MEDTRTPIDRLSKAGSDMLAGLSQDPEQYAAFLRFQGRIYKHNANVALTFYAQRPAARFIATREQWERQHYTIAQGETAVRFVGRDGRQIDLYDFTQTEQEAAP